MKIENFDETMKRVMEGKSNILVATYTRATRISAKHINAWKKAGYDLIKQEGAGYRLRQGKSSVYCFDTCVFEESI